MTALGTEELPLRTDQDVVSARHVVRSVCQELKFSLINQTKLVTAASELARNARTHGGGGTMVCEKIEEGARVGVRVTFRDEGPGIADLELAMTDGWSSGGGLGMGLSGSKRLVNDFKIDSAAGRGTTIVVTQWR